MASRHSWMPMSPTTSDFEAKVRYWVHWIDQISRDWAGEVPLRLHGRDTDDGGNPDFHPAFVSYIGYLQCAVPSCPSCRRERSKLHNRANRDGRSRATKALRKVRRVSPKEYDAVYSVCVLGFSIPETAARFNRNNELKGYPERYTDAGVTILVLSGIDKVIHFWRSV